MNNSDIILEAPLGIKRPTLNSRSFTYAAPFLWNNLPDDLRNIESQSTYKRKQLTYLFKAAF